MRVLLVCQPVEGGVPRHVAALARDLPDHGVEVVVATTPSAWARRLRDAGATVVDVPMVREVAPAADREALRRLRAIAVASHVDLVHAHSAKAGVLGRLAARRTGLPAVYTPHAWSFHAAGGPVAAAVYRTIERTLAHATERIICVSSGERERGSAVADPGRLVVIPNGIAVPDEPRPPAAPPDERSTTFVIGTIARLAAQKGVDVLLAATAGVLRAGHDVRLVVAGDGPQRRQLEHRARELGIADRTRFLGAVASPWPLLATLDLFVLPSRWEGLAYTLLEAMAAGLPCVATAVDGVADVIADRRLGTIVPIGDPDRMACEIIALVEDASARRAMGERAREHVRSAFSEHAMVERTVEVYRAATATRPPSTVRPADRPRPPPSASGSAQKFDGMRST